MKLHSADAKWATAQLAYGLWPAPLHVRATNVPKGLRGRRVSQKIKIAIVKLHYKKIEYIFLYIIHQYNIIINI